MPEKVVIGFFTDVIQLPDPEWILQVAALVAGLEQIAVVIPRGIATRLGARLSDGSGIADPRDMIRQDEFNAAVSLILATEPPALERITGSEVSQFEVTGVPGNLTSVRVSCTDPNGNNFLLLFDQTASFRLHQDLLDAMETYR